MQDIQLIEIQSRKYLNEITSAVINSDADKERACNFLKEISFFKKSVESQKREQTFELKAQLKEIEGRFKPALDFIAEADAITREKINNYLNAERERLEALALQQKKIQEEEALKRCQQMEELKKDADKYDIATRDAIIQSIEAQQFKEIENSAVSTKVNLSSASSTVRNVWTFEVEDISKVPAEFLEVNTKAINESIRAGVRDISGLKIYQKSIVSIK